MVDQLQRSRGPVGETFFGAQKFPKASSRGGRTEAIRFSMYVLMDTYVAVRNTTSTTCGRFGRSTDYT